MVSDQTNKEDPWAPVRAALNGAVGIAWEGCHKIYILMDDEAWREQVSYDYDYMMRVDEWPLRRILEALHQWFDQSCSLRFIDSVTTNKEDPLEGYATLIAQFQITEEENES